MIRRILLPVYGTQDDRTAFDHAVRLAERFGAELLVAPIVDKGEFMDAVGGPSEGATCYLDRGALDAFTQEVRREARALAEEAAARGRTSIVAPSPSAFPDDLIHLTRQCDLLVESEMHRRPLLARKLLECSDLYTDAMCPILLSHGQPFQMELVMLVYTASDAASRALNWLTELGEHTELSLHAVVMDSGQAVRERLQQEVLAKAKAHGVRAQVREAAPGAALSSVATVAGELMPGLIALPMHTFRRPLRLWLAGIDQRAVDQLGSSVVLFP